MNFAEFENLALSANAMLYARREAELSLLASELRYKTLIDQAADGIFLADEQGTIIEANQRACESLNYSQEEIIGMNITDLDGNYSSKGDMERIFKELELSRHISLETSHRRKDGGLFPVELRIGVLEVENHRFFLGLARDISARVRAEEESA